MAVDTFFEGSNGKRKRGGVKEGRGGRGRGGSSSSTRGGRVNGTHAGSGSSYKGKGREEPARRSKVHDEEIEGSDSENEDGSDNEELNGNDDNEEFESDQEADRKETPAQKRLRLAQQYLDTLKAAQEGALLFFMIHSSSNTLHSLHASKFGQ